VLYQGEIGNWLSPCSRCATPALAMGVDPADSEYAAITDSDQTSALQQQYHYLAQQLLINEMN